MIVFFYLCTNVCSVDNRSTAMVSWIPFGAGTSTGGTLQTWHIRFFGYAGRYWFQLPPLPFAYIFFFWHFCLRQRIVEFLVCARHAFGLARLARQLYNIHQCDIWRSSIRRTRASLIVSVGSAAGCGPAPRHLPPARRCVFCGPQCHTDNDSCLMFVDLFTFPHCDCASCCSHPSSANWVGGGTSWVAHADRSGCHWRGGSVAGCGRASVVCFMSFLIMATTCRR